MNIDAKFCNVNFNLKLISLMRWKCRVIMKSAFFDCTKRKVIVLYSYFPCRQGENHQHLKGIDQI